MPPQSDSRVRYVFDAKSSQFTVQAFAEGLAGIADHRPRFAIRDFSGEAELNGGRLDAATLQMSVTLGSLAIMDEVSEADRRAIERSMFEEVLETRKYPAVVLKSSRVTSSPVGENRYRVTVVGVVTLHGRSNQHSVEAQVVTSEDSLRVYGDFRLRQTDYGIKIASVAGGTVRIKDEVKLVFFLVARKQD